MRERNGSGYFDPTADAAIYKADRKPRRVDLDDLSERKDVNDGKEDDGGKAQPVPRRLR